MTTGTGRTKYAAVRSGLLARIAGMAPGSQLPAEPVLCEEFGVSRITLRHAVDGLVRDGRLIRRHGRGTFVTEPAVTMRYPERFTDRVTGFFRQQHDAGHEVTTRVLRQELAHAGENVARFLDIDFASRVIELVRLRYVNGQLHHHVVTYLPYDRFPDLLTEDFNTGSLFERLQALHAVALTRNDLSVGIEPAAGDIALNLAVEPDERLLRIDSTVFDADGTPAAYGVARHTPANSEITLSLHAANPHPSTTQKETP